MKGGEKLESKKVRYEYIDVLKFLGIFAIYLGHITSPSGSVYKFVFLYHVPLFFFVSGCMDMNKEMIFKSKNEKNYLSKQYISSIVYDIKTLIIPWLFFAIFSIIVNILNYGFEKER
ncbi:MAG: acyltransferase family protein, partial [Lachnospiraceae bacterium]|nr:acyltransferase family protein [Lachnospiraceae bacterium]